MGAENKKYICTALLAHVDAGKTTLSEAMLYLSGRIRKLGRVDHRDSFLDTHSLERQRGITIFSKQAVMSLEKTELSLLDTPGHMDFSAETERTLQVLDYAILVISGSDGVQAHTETLWRLLRRYNVPCFIFVTKMDLPDCDKGAILEDLQRHLSENCFEYGSGDEFNERLALCSEAAMDTYLSRGSLNEGELAQLIKDCAYFPCFFGSGLKTEGVEEFLSAFDRLTVQDDAGDAFSARVFKIARDSQDKRLTYLKVTGGELKVRDSVKYRDEQGKELEEKISQLRIYSGNKFEAVDSVLPGQVCAALGLSASYPGQGLGQSVKAVEPVLEPVVSYRIILPPHTEPRVFLPKLRMLQEEDPKLGIVWEEALGCISVQLMGKVQTEVFISLVKERFDTDISLDEGRIMYRETIASKVEGVGHFEPLRHYAEVHLILEPQPAGSGIVIDSSLSEDELDRNWQRLILSHVLEKRHLGVLTGSPITDIKFTLAAGRAHLKHTEGGDFRQATYRAIRQGLMQAESVLLEPWYSFNIEVPPEQIGRAISDIRAMSGSFSSPEDSGDMLRIEGFAPVSEMNGYMNQLISYTHGRGRLFCRPCGYRPCHNSAAVIESIGYRAENDTENTADSVFCAHGAGFNVKWDKVPEYMHLDSVLKPRQDLNTGTAPIRRRSLDIDERELEAIMEREFGPIRRPVYSGYRNEAPAAPASVTVSKKEYLIVDGYNVIFAWSSLKELARDNMDLARSRLMDTLSSYCGYTKAELVLVFDAYRNPGSAGKRSDYHNIHVAYTADGETGDAYIERIANQIGKNYSVRVITSDNLIRLSALRSGVLRTSSKEFEGEVDWVLGQIDEVLRRTNASAHTTKLKDGKQ